MAETKYEMDATRSAPVGEPLPGGVGIETPVDDSIDNSTGSQLPLPPAMGGGIGS